MSQGFKVAAALLLAITLAAPVFAQGDAASLYKAKCAMCHGADGLAATPVGKTMKVLSFKAPEMVSATDARFIASTTNGKGKMPAYKDKLTAAQIKDVVAYIRTLQK
jgi:mono/diheme cytochrome c family protein